MSEPARSAFPFTLRRKSDVVGWEIISTRETVHGLLRLDADSLTLQWRVARTTERVGMEIRTDTEVEAVREVVLPIAALAGAQVRRLWRWPPGRYLVLTAADLRALESVTGSDGLQLEHPAELALPVPRRALLAAREFAGELELALAERNLRAAERQGTLPRGATEA